MKTDIVSSITTLGLVLGVLGSSLLPAMAQPTQPGDSSGIQFSPPIPPDTGEPGDRGQGGGARGDCPQYEGLLGLVPQVQTRTGPISWGLTTRDRPTVWVYAPRGIQAATPLEFVLRERSGKTVYKQRFQATATPAGVVSLPLPSTSPALQVGQSYRWTFSVYCNAQTPDRPVTLRGSIQRVAPGAGLQQQLTQAKTPQEQAFAYASAGIWYDALTLLGQRLQTTSRYSSTQTAWADLLRQGKLEPASQATIVPCCKLPE